MKAERKKNLTGNFGVVEKGFAEEASPIDAGFGVQSQREGVFVVIHLQVHLQHPLDQGFSSGLDPIIRQHGNV